MEGKFVAYYRVSTQQQGKSGLGEEAQRKAVHDYLDGGRWKLVGEYTEVESGKRSDNRPQLAAALAAAKKHKAKLLIAKLDRLARNVHFISGLMESGVDFVAVDMPEANKFTVHIVAAMAEYERDMISQRTKDALQAAKARGTRLGNPKNLAEAQAKGRATRQARARVFAENTLPVVQEIRKAGVTSLNGIAKYLNARGVKTPLGRKWQAVSVRNLLARTI